MPIHNLTAQQQLGYGDPLTIKYLVDLIPPQYEGGTKDAELQGDAPEYVGDLHTGMYIPEIIKVRKHEELYSPTDFKHLEHGLARRLAPIALQRESSGNYRAVNRLGYIGGYQQGAAMLSDLGIVKRGTKNSGLDDPNNWLKYSKTEYLNNPRLQDMLFEKEVILNAKRVRKGKGKSTSEKDLYGMLMAAHLLGAAGAKRRGRDGKTDANGVTFKEYYKLGLKAYSNL